MTPYSTDAGYLSLGFRTRSKGLFYVSELAFFSAPVGCLGDGNVVNIMFIDMEIAILAGQAPATSENTSFNDVSMERRVENV